MLVGVELMLNDIVPGHIFVIIFPVDRCTRGGVAVLPGLCFISTGRPSYLSYIIYFRRTKIRFNKYINFYLLFTSILRWVKQWIGDKESIELMKAISHQRPPTIRTTYVHKKNERSKGDNIPAFLLQIQMSCTELNKRLKSEPNTCSCCLWEYS